MAVTNKTYLDYAGLQKYDGLIKDWVGDQVEALDATEFAIAAKDGSTNVVTIHGVKEADGIIAVGDTVANDVVLAAVAATGAAGDVSVLDAAGNFQSTDVEGALAELATAAGGGVASKTVYITETAGSSSDAFSKRYGVYQGANGSSSSPVVGEKLADIDIPKDMVVEAGEVVDVVFVAADNSLHEGSASGPDVTTEIKGSGTATSADAGKYIKLTIANAASSHLWIKATDLVDIYTVEAGATQVQLAISNSNEISATLVAGGVSATELASNAVTTAKILDANVTTAKIADDAVTADKVSIAAHSEANAAQAGADGLLVSVTTTDGQVSGVSASIAANTYEAYGAVSTAIGALDTANDVSIASYTAGTSGAADVITLQGSISESDGIVGAGSADGITLSTITDSEIEGLFS